MADPPPTMDPNMDNPKMDIAIITQQLNSLKMQNSCIRVMLTKEKEKTAYLEKLKNAVPSTPQDGSEITEQDILFWLFLFLFLEYLFHIARLTYLRV